MVWCVYRTIRCYRSNCKILIHNTSIYNIIVWKYRITQDFIFRCFQNTYRQSVFQMYTRWNTFYFILSIVATGPMFRFWNLYQPVSNTGKRLFLGFRKSYSPTFCIFGSFAACPTTQIPINCDISLSTVTYLSCSSCLLRLARLPDLTFPVLPIPPLGLFTS